MGILSILTILSVFLIVYVAGLYSWIGLRINDKGYHRDVTLLNIFLGFWLFGVIWVFMSQNAEPLSVMISSALTAIFVHSCLSLFSMAFDYEITLTEKLVRWYFDTPSAP